MLDVQSDLSRGRVAPCAAWKRRVPRLGSLFLTLSTVSLLACGPDSGEGTFPPDVPDPAIVKTAAGALAFYRQVVTSVPLMLDPLVIDVGVVTDELVALPVPVFQAGRYTTLDSREELNPTRPTAFVNHYGSLHRLRAQAREARGFAATYLANDAGAPLRGHLYALEGYAEVFLADLFCSGIPLSTVDYQGDYTLAAGSSTEAVYEHAVKLFDTALVLAAGVDSLRALAAVGRGRALLALGRYAEAAAAVSAVPDGYQSLTPAFPDPSAEVWRDIVDDLLNPVTDNKFSGLPSVGDGEGGRVLDYLSSGDPRTPAVSLGPDAGGFELFFPAKYPQDGTVTFVLASGVEARLIQAEAELQADPTGAGWLQRLNQLRQTVGLADTTDPGAGLSDAAAALAARVDLLFRERAFWLYLTGQRLGDWRRLVRVYGRPAETVYPTDPGGIGSKYAPYLVAPVPESERQLNARYTGCLHSKA